MTELKIQTKSETKYCHFTSVENAREILSTETFYLSKYSQMNDLAEAKIHSDETNDAFSLCFSNSEALNIPAFYLYGGIDGKGCKIQFTRAKLNEIINDCTVFYVNKQNKKLRREVPKSAYSIYYDWIYYVSSNGYCDHKINGSKQFNGIEEALNELKKSNRHYFVKNPIWKYENEFRIVVAFNSKVKYSRIAIEFNILDKDRGVSVVFGPETTENEYSELSKEFSDYGVMKKEKTSDYAISMKLIERNRKLLKGVL